MDDKSYFELPTPTEKLSSKFILDALLEQRLRGRIPGEVIPAPVVKISEVADAKTPEELSPAQMELCGTQAAPPGAPHTVELHNEPPSTEPIPVPELALPDGKKYFRIGEVSELIGVESYVLRYWESEFSVIRPTKSRTGHRVYSRRDVENLHLVRHLLHTEKFSIKGAKKKLLERRREMKQAVPTLVQQKNQEALKEVLHELKELVHLMKTNPGAFWPKPNFRKVRRHFEEVFRWK